MKRIPPQAEVLVSALEQLTTKLSEAALPLTDAARMDSLAPPEAKKVKDQALAMPPHRASAEWRRRLVKHSTRAIEIQQKWNASQTIAAAHRIVAALTSLQSMGPLQPMAPQQPLGSQHRVVSPNSWETHSLRGRRGRGCAWDLGSPSGCRRFIAARSCPGLGFGLSPCTP